jgi:hypothetical protein
MLVDDYSNPELAPVVLARKLRRLQVLWSPVVARRPEEAAVVDSGDLQWALGAVVWKNGSPKSSRRSIRN